MQYHLKSQLFGDVPYREISIALIQVAKSIETSVDLNILIVTLKARKSTH